jgi:hypothetical protein
MVDVRALRAQPRSKHRKRAKYKEITKAEVRTAMTSKV